MQTDRKKKAIVGYMFGSRRGFVLFRIGNFFIKWQEENLSKIVEINYDLSSPNIQLGPKKYSMRKYIKREGRLNIKGGFKQKGKSENKERKGEMEKRRIEK